MLRPNLPQASPITCHLHLYGKTVVNEDTCQLISDGFLQGHQQQMSQPHLRGQEGLYGHQLFQRICAICISTKLAIDQSPWHHRYRKKVFKISLPYTGVTNFWVELDTVEVFLVFSIAANGQSH